MEEKKPRPVKKPDVKAPRFRKTEFIHNVVSEDLYTRWKKENHSSLTFKEFVGVWERIAETLRGKIVSNPYGIRLPFFNGDIGTNYVTSLKKHINSKASREVGYFIPELDWHTNRRPGKICYSINHARRQHRWLILFAFEPCAKLRDAASSGFKNNPEIYRLARNTAYVGYKQSKDARR